jgi:hypothetical protein
MATGPVWDGKIYKQAKFGNPFDWNTVKGAQRRQQVTGSDVNGRSRIAMA